MVYSSIKIQLSLYYDTLFLLRNSINLTSNCLLKRETKIHLMCPSIKKVLQGPRTINNFKFTSCF